MPGLSGQGKTKGKILSRFEGLPKGTLVPIESVLEGWWDGGRNGAGGQAWGLSWHFTRI